MLLLQGVDAIGASLALLRGVEGFPGLQRAALHTLLQPDILQRLGEDLGDEVQFFPLLQSTLIVHCL